MKNEPITGITKAAFLKLKFPVLPYCIPKRGPSTKYNESFHIENQETKTTLNFWWDNDNTISIGVYYGNEPNSFKKNVTIATKIKIISESEIVDLCEKYLK
jgi:hypothetical protein